MTADDILRERNAARQMEWCRYLHAFHPVPPAVMSRIHDAERLAESMGCRVCDMPSRVQAIESAVLRAKHELSVLESAYEG
jgi:hypothetical protein